MKLKLFLLLVVSCQLALAGIVRIEGGIKGFEGKTISANKVEDFITNDQTVLSEQTISNGSFVLEFDVASTQQIILQIEDKSTSMFVNPAKTYKIGLSYDAEANRANAFKKFLDISFVFPDPLETNSLIKQFNRIYQDFFSENYKMIVLKKANKETEEFVKKQREKPAYQNDKFVKDYVTYGLANLEDITYLSKDEVFAKYILEQPVLHNNKEYMNFITQHYKSDFEKLTLSGKGQDLLKAITFDKDYTKTIEEIKKAKGFKNDELAEFYLCFGLFEVFHTKRVNQTASLNMLEQINKKASNSGNRILAENIKQQLSLYGKNQKAPNFNLKDLNGDVFQLSDFNGKVVYLNFWADWSIPSLREMQIIKALHEKYKDKVHFISINVDEGTEKLSKLQKNKNYPWTMLHYGDDYKVRERFNVKTVPTYFLIDVDGKMITPFAPGPTDIEKVLFELQ